MLVTVCLRRLAKGLEKTGDELHGLLVADNEVRSAARGDREYQGRRVLAGAGRQHHDVVDCESVLLLEADRDHVAVVAELRRGVAG